MGLSAETVRLLYGTVTGKNTIGDALERSQHDMGLDGFVWNDLPGDPAASGISGFTRQVSASFADVVFPDILHTLAHDPRVNHVISRRDRLFVSSEALGSAFGRDSYHREFLEGMLGTRYTMGFAVSAKGQQQSAGLLGLHRITSKGCFTDLQKQSAADLLSILREVISLRFELGATRAAAAVGEAVLDTLGEAVLVTDKALRLKWSNRLGEDLLRRGTALRLSEGFVRVGPEWSRTLAHAIGEVLEAGVVRRIPVGILDQQPLVMTIACCLEKGFAVAGPLQSGDIILRLSRPGPALEVAEQMRLLYGLTHAEALLAADLAAGRTVMEHTQVRGVKISTTRFHVRAILEKTASRDLQALALLLGRLSV
jgi:hypothetical protein